MAARQGLAHRSLCPSAGYSLFVACLQLQGHDLHRIHDEYVQFAEHKQRRLDQQHIEDFDPAAVIPILAPSVSWPPWFYVCESRAGCLVHGHHAHLGSGASSRRRRKRDVAALAAAASFSTTAASFPLNPAASFPAPAASVSAAGSRDDAAPPPALAGRASEQP